MSGIAGIIHFDGRPAEPGQIESMTAAMAYRGPDGINHWVKGSVALGHCLLQTTPESLEERQPVTNEDETLVLVMDGRVDNWEELRHELLGRGAVLRNRSDPELMLRAYQIWDRDFLQHVDGDFALVIWDAQRRTAVCARDRMGNKAFNYYWDGKTLAFASELHPLLALPWIAPTLNEGVLAEFLAVEYYSRDETFWRDIYRLVAGHWMEVNERGLRLESYWEPDFGQALPFRTDQEYVEHYRELFADSVRRMSRSHRPLAHEVSGGLDSSAIFSMADLLHRTDRLLAPGIDGYTLAFPEDEPANELVYSRSVAQHLGVEIHEFPPTLAPLRSYREWACHYREFPGAPHGVMSQDLRRHAVERGSRVIMSGSGGDEWGCGQRLYYAEELAAQRWGNLYRCLKADVQAYSMGTGLRWLRQYGIRPLLPPVIRRPLALGRRTLAQVAPTTRTETNSNAAVRNGVWLAPHLQTILEQRRQRSRAESAPVLSRRGQLAQYALLRDPWLALASELEDRACARLGLDYRRPLRSPTLVQYAFAVPERMRLRGRTNRYMHREAMRGILPENVRCRTTKAEFSVLFRHYLGSLEKEFRHTIPKKFTNWVLPIPVNTVYDYYQAHTANVETPRGGRSQFILWNLLACTMLLEAD